MQNKNEETAEKKGIIGPEDYEDFGNEDRNFADEFDKESPFYHGGDETPVPFDMMKIPETMATVYPDEWGRLQQLLEASRDTKDDMCFEIETASCGIRQLKHAWGMAADSILLRITQLEAAEKTKAKPSTKQPTLLTPKIKELLNACESAEKAWTANAYFVGFQSETAKAMEYLTSLDSQDRKSAKREVKKRCEKLAKLFVALQGQLMEKLKERKHLLMPSLKAEFTEIIKEVDNQVASLINAPQPSMDESEICEKPSHYSNADKFNTILNSKPS